MNKIDEMLASLNGLADSLELEKLAFDGAQNWVDSKEFAVEASVVKQMKFEFHSHKLCFRTSQFDYLYIETRLEVIYRDDYIGYYNLTSLLNGEPTDDMLVITDDDFKNRSLAGFS